MPILKRTSEITTQVLHSLICAEREILFQMYYVDNDSIFSAYAQTLIQKAHEGVSVYCLFDALGSSQISGSSIERELLEAGVQIQYFNWLTPWANKNKKILYFRNHKRSLIVDTKTLHIGGWCIGEKTEHWIEGHTQHTDLKLIQHAIDDFWDMYEYAHKTAIRFRQKHIYEKSIEAELTYTHQTPTLHGRHTYYVYKKLLDESQQRIVLVAPYFAPIRELRKSIYAAQKRHVQVEIFLPKKTDLWLADLVAKTYIHKLLKRGVTVYLSDTMVHAKVSMFDSTLYVGSMNLDAVSLRYNFENGIYTKDPQHIQEFTKDIETLAQTCEKLTLEDWEKRGFYERFLDSCMKIFRAFV